MKTKRKRFIQHLEHDDVENDDKVWDFLDEALPKIGLVIMYFNGLEKQLDSLLCQIFSDRTDAPGLIILQNMQYSAKVNLFSRFSDELHRDVGEVPPSYKGLLDNLRNAAKQRNIIAHADWESMDDEGYAYSTIRFSDGGMEQEYIQLTSATLESIIEAIQDVRDQLLRYWDAKVEILTR
jgi:hypothetical protein